MPISKTDFVRGLQCEKMLWLDAHAPEEKIIPPQVQAKLDAGNEFGDKAMGIFGDFVETTTLREDGRLYYAAMIEKTQALLQKGERIICEGSFTWYGNFCAADILKKEENGYGLYEVKNAFYPREEFIKDLGFQSFLLKKCGVKIVRCSLILRGDEPPEEIAKDVEQVCGECVEKDGVLYKIVDVTNKTRPFEKLASERIFELGKLKKKDAEMPCIAMGEQCEKPYPCWYLHLCQREKL